MTGQDRTSDGASRAPIWSDAAPVDPSWAEPQDPDTRSATGVRRRLLTIGIPVLAVVVLIGAVFAFGGFTERDDTITYLKLGTTFTNGAYEFSFSSATVQSAPGYAKYKRIQKVMVTGTMRNNSDKSVAPDDGWFLARGVHDPQVQTADNAVTGKTGQFNGPDKVTPGLPPVRLTVEFDFPPTFTDTELLFGMRQLTYGTHSYLSGNSAGAPYWDAGGNNTYQLHVPMKRLPAAQY